MPQPLCVRVVNGQAPVIGAAVQFTVEPGGGVLTVAQPVITQAPDGIAACGWTLGNSASGCQRVRAELLDAAGHAIPGQVLHFNASLNHANLLYVGGDGQEAMPNGLLPQPLRVRVINEQAPVIGARVRFKVTQGNGSFPTALPAVTRSAVTHPPIPQAVDTQEDVTVSPDGIAQCNWILGSSGPQQVEAVLLDAGDARVPGQILCFNANRERRQPGGVRSTQMLPTWPVRRRFRMPSTSCARIDRTAAACASAQGAITSNWMRLLGI